MAASRLLPASASTAVTTWDGGEGEGVGDVDVGQVRWRCSLSTHARMRAQRPSPPTPHLLLHVWEQLQQRGNGLLLLMHISLLLLLLLLLRVAEAWGCYSVGAGALGGVVKGGVGVEVVVVGRVGVERGRGAVLVKQALPLAPDASRGLLEGYGHGYCTLQP